MDKLPLLALPVVDSRSQPVASAILSFNRMSTVSVKELNDYILVGENHYTSSEDKSALANAIVQLAAAQRIDLFVEASDVPASEEASDRLRKYIDEPYEREAAPAGVHNSLLLKLQDLDTGLATFFASRPEELEESMVVNPESLVRVLYITGTCLDLRPQRAVEAVKAVANMTEGVLGSALALTERLVREKQIDVKLLPIVVKYLKKHLVDLMDVIRIYRRSPLLYSLRDGLLPGRFFKVVTTCIFAPHVVSDAVLATQLMSTSPRNNPAVIVAGQAHIDVLNEMLMLKV